MARLLIERGYRDVWPLLGGFEAWQALGYPVELHPAPAPTPTAIEAVRSSAGYNS